MNRTPFSLYATRFALALAILLLAPSRGRADESTQVTPESNVISLADREGVRWATSSGDFSFKPFVLIQTAYQTKYLDHSWLELTELDRTSEVGFGIDNALLGAAGVGFGRVAFNLTLNAASSGGAILNQAWLDFALAEGLWLRAGKFKTPMHWSYLVRLGETELPRLPASLSSRVVPLFGLNAVAPTIGMGFDTGAMLHGELARNLAYELGLFSGEGIGSNKPTSTMSDQHEWLPGLLYAARLAYTPMGPMAPREGSGGGRDATRILFAASTSYNVEASAESSNDLRAGLEFALTSGALYWSTEAYLLDIDYVELQKATNLLFAGAHTQLGYALGYGFEPVVRLELFDRNSTQVRGVFIVPSIGLGYSFSGQNLKLQAMYQGLARLDYASSEAAHHDAAGLPDGLFVLQLQAVL